MIYRDDLAHVHDHGFADVAAHAGAVVLAHLRAAGLRSGRIVDLGCGSGRWLARAGAAGYDTTGVDRSSAMLALARRQAPAARLVHGNAARVALPAAVAITATGEVLSHGPRALPLPALFARAFRVLAPGGLFLFDLLATTRDPPLSYRTWRAGDGWAVLIEVRERPATRSLERHIVTFRAHGRGFRRSEERHALVRANPREVLAGLRAAGFRARVGRHYGERALAPGRRVFWAVKPR